jgi:hypothetical protein
MADRRPQTADRTTPEAGKRKAIQDWIGLDWRESERDWTGLAATVVDAGESSGVSAGEWRRRGSIMQKAGRGHAVASSSERCWRITATNTPGVGVGVDRGRAPVVHLQARLGFTGWSVAFAAVECSAMLKTTARRATGGDGDGRASSSSSVCDS